MAWPQARGCYRQTVTDEPFCLWHAERQGKGRSFVSEKWSGALAKPNGCWQKSGLRARLEQEIGLKCFFRPRQSLLRALQRSPSGVRCTPSARSASGGGARHSQPCRPLAMVKGFQPSAPVTSRQEGMPVRPSLPPVTASSL